MRLKYILEGILITLIVAIIIHVITINSVANELIHVKELPSVSKIFTTINNEIEKIEDDKCKSSINSMLTRIKKTYFAKDITVEEYINAYYENEKKFIDFYEDVKTSCELEEKNDIYVLVLSSLNYPTSIKNRYDLRHEFNIRDNVARSDLYKNSDEVGTYTTKLLELEVIERLISEVLK